MSDPWEGVLNGTKTAVVSTEQPPPLTRIDHIGKVLHLMRQLQKETS
jgi:hypothetical protein